MKAMIIFVPLIVGILVLIVDKSMPRIANGDRRGDRTDLGLTISVFGVLFLVFSAFAAIGIMFVISNHRDDLARLRFADQSIAIQQAKIQQIQNLMDRTYGIQANSLIFQANSDTPTKSLVDNLVYAQNKVAEMQQSKLDVQKDIVRRKLGWYSFVVRWYGEQ